MVRLLNASIQVSSVMKDIELLSAKEPPNTSMPSLRPSNVVGAPCSIIKTLIGSSTSSTTHSFHSTSDPTLSSSEWLCLGAQAVFLLVDWAAQRAQQILVQP